MMEGKTPCLNADMEMEKHVERRSKADDIALDTHYHHCFGAALGRICPIQRKEIGFHLSPAARVAMRR